MDRILTHTYYIPGTLAADLNIRFKLPCEYLRVYSPSAEVQGHSPDERVLQVGKEERRRPVQEPQGKIEHLFGQRASSRPGETASPRRPLRTESMEQARRRMDPNSSSRRSRASRIAALSASPRGCGCRSTST